MPRHLFKLALDWRAAPTLRLGLDVFASGDQVVAGNESGNRPELGKLAGYAVANVRAAWQFAAGWEGFLRVNNVFDRHYANFASGNLDFYPAGQPLPPGGEAAAARFIAPGAPRTASLGVRYAWKP